MIKFVFQATNGPAPGSPAGSVGVRSSCSVAKPVQATAEGSAKQDTPSSKGNDKDKGDKGICFICKCTGKKTMECDRVPSYSVSREGKRAYDSLSKLSARQNQSEWWTVTKCTPKLLYKAINTYIKVCPSLGQNLKGKKRNATGEGFKVAEYKEIMRSTSELGMIEQGKMMWKEEYIEFAATTPAGNISRGIADMNWTSWAADMERLRDHQGPVQAPLRLYVKMGDHVNFSSNHSLSRQLEVGNGRVNNPTEAYLNGTRAELLRGATHVAGADVTNFRGIANGMVTGAAQAAMEGVASEGSNFTGAFASDGGVNQVSIADMLVTPFTSEEVADQVSADRDSVETGSCSSQQPKKKAKKTPYYDIERNRTIATTNWNFTVNTMAANAAKIVQEAETFQKDVDALPNKNLVATSAELLAKRLAVLVLCFPAAAAEGEVEKASAGLAVYLDGFKADPSATPPIMKYLDLCTLPALKKKGDLAIAEALDKSSLDAAKKFCDPAMAALRDLLGTSKNLANDGKAALKKAVKAGGSAASSRAAAPAAAGKLPSIWELALDKGQQVMTIKHPLGEHDKATFNPNTPMLITAIDALKEAASNEAVAPAMKSFQSKFTGHPLRAKDGRAQKNEIRSR